MGSPLEIPTPIPDSRFPIPDSRFPIPDSRFPIAYPLSPSLLSERPAQEQVERFVAVFVEARR